MLLQSEGRLVSACVNAEDALALDASEPFDLVITDVTLPGMSGLEFSARLLSADAARQIIVCSGYQLDREIGELGGRNVRTLVKPFGIDELESVLDRVEASLSSER
ncbi:response regulator [Diaphorobacter aerolatus]|nr:response regulator [Diaphorobacter aerolatus]